jgi:hypothetical protein
MDAELTNLCATALKVALEAPDVSGTMKTTTLLKSLSRRLYEELEAKQRLVDEHREQVDKAHLHVDNLQYKKAHLLREISLCKGLETPELSKVEQSTGLDLTNQFADSDDTMDVDAAVSKSMSSLQNELEDRKEMEKELEQKKAAHANFIVKLDRRRQAMDEVKLKFDLVKASSEAYRTTLERAIAMCNKEKEDVQTNTTTNTTTNALSKKAKLMKKRKR